MGDQPACGNTNDVAAQKSKFPEMQKDITTCLLQCANDDHAQTCAQKCISSTCGFSPPCADCWVAHGMCCGQECMFKCIKPTSPACIQCAKEKCFPQTAACTGLPEWSFPLT